MTVRHLRWGLVAAAVYVAAGLIPASMGVPVLPVFDGLAPPEPYRWVEAPPDAANPVGDPLGGEDTISIEDNFGAFTVITADGQAQATMLVDAVELPEGEEAVQLRVTPVDPQSLGPPPGGLRFDSNAYRIEATYVPSGDPVVVTDEATILLRYAIHAEEVLRWGGDNWQRLETTLLQGTLQVFANTSDLGTFVAAGPDPEGPGLGWPWWVGMGAAAVAVLIALEVLLRRRRAAARRGRPGKAAARRAAKRATRKASRKPKAARGTGKQEERKPRKRR